MSVPISTSSTSSTSYTQARNTTASDNINNIAKDSLNKGGKFNNRYVCEVCHKTFMRNGHLINHMQTHTGEKPFKCTKCDKAFSQKGHLKSHARSAHEVAEMFEINSSNCNNTRDEMIANYQQEIQAICKNRKIKICTKAIKNMIFTLRHKSEKQLTDETLNRFFYKTRLF